MTCVASYNQRRHNFPWRKMKRFVKWRVFTQTLALPVDLNNHPAPAKEYPEVVWLPVGLNLRFNIVEDLIWVVSTPCHTSALSPLNLLCLFVLPHSFNISVRRRSNNVESYLSSPSSSLSLEAKRVSREKSSIDWFSMTKHHLYCDECQFFLSLLVAHWRLSSNSSSQNMTSISADV